MNNNILNSISSCNDMAVNNHNVEKQFGMLNFICVTSNSNNNHLISITNTCPGQGKLTSFSDFALSNCESTPSQMKPFPRMINDQFSNNNHIVTESNEVNDSKFGLPRQRSFDQAGESRLSSSQVKQKLKECVLNKKNSKVSKSPNTGPSPQNSFESEEMQNSSMANNCQQSESYPPLNSGIISISHDDFPIRKTSSLPDLKVRSALKQKAMDRRPSPLSKKLSKICSNNASVSKSTVSGLIGFSQSSILNSTGINTISSSGTFAQNPEMCATNINCGKYQPHLYDSDHGQSFPVNFSGSTPFKSLNLTPQVDLYQSTSYQLPLQALFNSQPQLVPAFNSLPNLNLGHSLSAILSANKPCGSVIDFNKTKQPNYVENKDMDSSCSQSPDVILEQKQNSNISPISSSVNQSLMYGYNPRIITNSGGIASSRQRTQRVLNRTNSAPLPLGNNNTAVSAVQLALQEQKLLFIKAQLRQKVLHRSNTGKNVQSNEDFNMMVDRNPEFDWKNACTRTLSDSLIDTDRFPQRSLSLEESSSEIELGQSGSTGSFSPDSNKTNSSFQYRMLSNHSSNSGFSMQISNSSSITKLPSPILEEKILENTNTTAIIYDVGMLSHRCLCGNEDIHPESSRRLSAVWDRLKESQIVVRCHVIQGKKASMDDLQLCHEDTYSVLFGTNPANRLKINPQLLMSVEFCRLPCGGIGVDVDTVWNNAHTANAARLAVGCVVELTLKIVRGEIRNGFAIVRPPGHNAEFNQAMGFGYFNSVAIAAKKVTMQTAVKRVLIIDWDIHHGNGTQQIFYNDPSVLYISLHRHDNGHFFPGTGLIEEIGDGAGTNYNINIAWKTASDAQFTSMADAEYMAAFIHIVLPVAKEFNPDLILVSAGFDATKPHSSSLGGYNVSPACFGWMTQRLILSGLAEGRLILALEGGYDIGSLCDSVEVCMRTLIKPDGQNFTDCVSRQLKEGDPNMCIPSSELNRIPKDEAIETLYSVSQLHKKKWQCFRYLRKESMKYSYSDLITLHSCNKLYDSIPLLAMAELTVQHEQKSNSRNVMDYSLVTNRQTISHSEPMDQEIN